MRPKGVWIGLLAAVFCPIVTSVHAQTPAGTPIDNQASAGFQSNLVAETALSNVVTTNVGASYTLRLTPPGTVAAPARQLAGVAGDTLYCTFTIDNLGNAPDSAAATYQVLPVSNTLIGNVIFFRDTNGNGRFDPGEENPSFLAIGMGGSATMETAVVIPAGAASGVAYIEVQVVSTNDTTPAMETSVIRVANNSPSATTMHIGPAGNATALPGGEGSGDDITSGTLGYADYTFTFDNDVLNQAGGPDAVELVLPDSLALPVGVSVTLADSTGTPLPPSGGSTYRSLLGIMAAGETRRVQLTLTSATTPLFQALGGAFDLVVRARSLNDTLVTNATIDRLVPPAAVAPGAALVLEQAFREAVVSVGDVATLVITVRNVTDSLRVDNVVVTEFAQAQLDFAGSPDFSWNGSALLWNAGTLAGGESKQTVVKFVVNSRVAHGNAKAIGNASGTAISNNTVNATPVISLVKIDNDIFSAEGLIFGEVFVDSDGNGRRDEGEIGVPGAAVYLESGEYAITDSTGTYSLPRIFSGYRIVRLDEESLPADVVFAQPLTGGQGRRGNEQIAHLLPGGHARVSFPLAERPPAMIDVTHTMSLQERVSVTKQARLYQAFVMPSSYFAPGKAKLIVGATRDMRPIVEFLEEHPDWRVLVEGHTDSTPIRTKRFPSNHELSLARASDVRDYLSTSGVSNGRILVVGHGESRPIATNGTVEGRSINRRVEISFIPPDVKISEHDSLQRVPGTIRDLSILPDTFHVNVVWELITTVDAPAEGALRLHIPRNFENPDVRVQLGEKTLALEDDEYRFAGFARGHPLSVKIKFRSSSPDTSHIRDIRGVLSFDHHPAAAPATSSPASGQRYPLSPITLRPHEAGSSSRVTTQSDLIEWRSEESLVGPKQGTNPTAPVDAQPPIVVQPDEPQDGGPVTLLSPVDGTIFAHRDQIQVRARIPIGARAELFVGGSPIDQDRLGRRVIDTQAGEEILSWFGVRIAGGWNTIEVRASVPGQATDADTITVALSAQPRSVVALQKSQIIEADGHSRVPVRFAVRDGYALPVMDGIVATVIEGSEFVEARDARPSERGLQLVTASGFVDILTRPRGETGRGRVVIECQGMRAETELIWVSPRRPFLATGVIDVNVGVFTTSGDGDPLGVENFTDGFDVQAESRLFLQGPVMHGASLTARLDTKKRFDDPLLKDLNPDRQYPVYGDGSTMHFAAPSQGGNYVSLDRGESFLRYGDFHTGLDQGELLVYQRATTGVNANLFSGSDAVKAFVAKTDFVTQKDQMPADGTSGFYYLSRKPIVENSEMVVVETRDRFQTEIVLDIRPMIRNQDYTINPFDGSILFKKPIPAFDMGFNPVYIVVIYEIESVDKGSHLYGIRGDLASGRSYRAGFVGVTNDGELTRYSLYGVDGEVSGKGFRLGGELARSEDTFSSDGNAYKVRAGYEGGGNGISLYHRRIDGGFNNPSFRGSNSELATLKSGFEGALGVGRKFSVNADGYAHELFRSNEHKSSARGIVAYRHKSLELQAGGRTARHDQASGDEHGVLSILGLKLGAEKRFGLASQWEKNLGDEYVEDFPDRLRTQAAAPIGGDFRVLLSHEYSTAPGRPGTNQFTAGVEGQPAPGTTAYSKYSMNHLAGDTRMGAVSGVLQSFAINDRVTGTVGLEGFLSMSNRDDDEYFSFKSGTNWRVPASHFVEAQYELRWQRSRTRNMIRLNAAQQFRAGTGLLIKNVLSFSDVSEGDNELSYHNTLAGAYRPLAGPVQTLVMMRNYYERFTPVDPDAIRWRLVLSGDVNWRPRFDHEVRFKYAYKHMEDFSFGLSTTTDTDLVLGQYIYRFAPRWDVDAWGRWLNQRGGGTAGTGVGIEVGHLFFRTLRVAAGYSINGFEDPDITSTDAWSKGFNLRVQLILSEWILADFEKLNDE